MAGGRLEWQDSELFNNARHLPGKIDGMVATVVGYYTTVAQAHMRREAPWRDQTGNARNGLKATAVHNPYRNHQIILSHGVNYGIWLEVRWSGRYSIINPTMRVIGPQIMDMIGRRWGPTIGGGH